MGSFRNELTQEKEGIVDVYGTPILFLVGGKGSRVQEITNDEIPKPLIKITDENTLIDLICINLVQIGYKNFIFCIGHHGEALEAHLSQSKWAIGENAPNLKLSKEEPEMLLGPTGAAFRAIESMQLQGPVIILPGDMFLPWINFEDMIRFHMSNSADMTLGVTSTVTEKTSDIGKIFVDRASNRIVKCYPRDAVVPQPSNNMIPLTSAGVEMVDAQKFLDIYASYIKNTNIPENTPISMRDDVLPWALIESNCQIYAFDLTGEALDIGTVDRVEYARSNWKNYMREISTDNV